MLNAIKLIADMRLVTFLLFFSYLLLWIYTGSVSLAENLASSNSKVLFSKALDLIESKNFASAAEILESISLRPDDTASNLNRFYLLGHCYRKLGLWDKAIKNYQKVDNGYQFSDYAIWHTAELYQKISDWQNAISWYKRLIEKYPDNFNVYVAQYQMANCYQEIGNYQSTLLVYEALIQNPSSGYARKAGYQAAIAYEGLKDLKSAFLRYQKLIDEDQSDSVAKEALDRVRRAILTQKPPPLEPFEVTRTQRFSYGMVLLNSGKYPEARAEFERAAEAKEDKDDPLAQKSLYYIGQSYHSQRDYKAAMGIYQKVVDRYPQGEYITRAKYQIALCYRRLGDYDKASRLFEDFISSYSWSDLADDALFDIASMNRLDKKYNEAMDAYARLMKLYSKSPLLDESLWWLSWCRMKVGLLEEAIQGFQDLLNRFPQSPFVGTTRFWIGKIQERLNRWDEARATYEALINDKVWYYSLRAKESLKKLAAEKVIKTNINLAESIRLKAQNPKLNLSSTSTWNQLNELPFIRASGLIQLKVYDDAIAELSGLAKSDSTFRKNTYYYLIICYQKEETFYQAWIYANRLAQLSALKSEDGSLPIELYKLLYPIYYRDVVFEACHEFHLDPLFVSAMIREESRHEAQVISSAGAYGLMQIMPATGSAVAKKLGVDNFNSQMLFQPKLNVRFGTWYMKQLMERFKHISQVEYIVSGAYNSGPDPVERWIEKYGVKDIDEFIEDIPYKETRNHIKKVMDSYQIYREIYGEEI